MSRKQEFQPNIFPVFMDWKDSLGMMEAMDIFKGITKALVDEPEVVIAQYVVCFPNVGAQVDSNCLVVCPMWARDWVMNTDNAMRMFEIGSDIYLDQDTHKVTFLRSIEKDDWEEDEV